MLQSFSQHIFIPKINSAHLGLFKKKLAFLLLFTLFHVVLISWDAGASEREESLVICLLPEINVFRQKQRFEPLAAYLSQHKGISVRLTMLSLYGNIIERMKKEEVDAAFLGSFSGALAISQLHVVPLARPINTDGTLTYYPRSSPGYQSFEKARQIIQESEELQNLLWIKVIKMTEEEKYSMSMALFINSLNSMFDLHSKRIYSVLYNRISISIFATLYFIGFLTMALMGYQAGLTGARSPIAAFMLILTFSMVLTLITDLERPHQEIFRVSQQTMVDLNNKINQTP